MGERIVAYKLSFVSRNVIKSEIAIMFHKLWLQFVADIHDPYKVENYKNSFKDNEATNTNLRASLTFYFKLANCRWKSFSISPFKLNFKAL